MRASADDIATLEGMMSVETDMDISGRIHVEGLFQSIVEAAPCAMIMIEPSDRIVFVNPQAESMFGYPRDELIGNSIEKLLPERFRTIQGALRRQMGVDRELIGKRKDGSEFPVEIGLDAVPADDRGLVLASVTDITRRSALKQELRQANANLEEFTCAASHDLKSPLRGIEDLVTWITEDLGATASAEVDKNLRRVMDRIRRLGGVIDDLLAYAHAGTTSSNVVCVDLRHLIDDVLQIQPLPSGFDISMQIDSTPFVTNKAPLESVLRNLISNAVKHHDRSCGSIVIGAQDVGHYCALTISDDGPGIPPAFQERVFRMFHTLAAGVTDHSGIGLALCKRLIEAHGGRIQLESTEGIRGTTFRVWWPRVLRRTARD
jgi:PAS domain S-box-containing protein